MEERGRAAAVGVEKRLELRAMIKWAIIFLVLGVILGALGFGGVGGAFVGIAKILFGIAIALFLLFLVLGIVAAKKVAD